MSKPNSILHCVRTIHRVRRRGGFTIVEILAVVGTITVLLGLLLAGLQAARRSGQSTVALNQLRQLHMASTAYTASNADRFMPGYVDDDTQSRWRLRYKYQAGGRIAPRLARTYPWRIMPYVDWSYDTMIGYNLDEELIDRIPRNGDVNSITPESIEVADNPWFGYNGYYVGGWWETDSSGTSKMKFANSTWSQEGTDGTAIETKGKIVVQSVGRAADPTQMVLFAGSTGRNPGQYRDSTDFEPGAAWVCPPKLAETDVWSIELNVARNPDPGPLAFRAGGSMFETPLAPTTLFAQGADVTVRVYTTQAIPYRRIGSQIPVVHLDGNTRGLGISELLDQRVWINAARDGIGNPREFAHTED